MSIHLTDDIDLPIIGFAVMCHDGWAVYAHAVDAWLTGMANGVHGGRDPWIVPVVDTSGWLVEDNEPPTCILTEADILAGRDDDCSLHDHE
jgi:hypothetical protein